MCNNLARILIHSDCMLASGCQRQQLFINFRASETFVVPYRSA